MSRPSENPEWATGASAITDPSLSYKQIGWVVGQKPPAQYFNWWQNNVYLWQQYTDIRVSGLKARSYFNITSVSPNGSNDLYNGVYQSTSTFYVVGGASGQLFTSSEATGRTWTSHVTGSANFYALASSGTVTIVADDAGNIWSTTDGSTFTSRTAAYSNANRRAAWGASIFVIVSDGGKIQTSPTGTTWTNRPNQVSTSNITTVHFDNSLFVAGTTDGKIQTSADGITWTLRDNAVATTARYNQFRYDATFKWMGFTGAGEIVTSPDAISWTKVATISGAPNLVGGADNTNGLFTAIDNLGNTYISDDTIGWTKQSAGFTPSASPGKSILYSNGLYFFFGHNGAIYRADSYQSLRTDIETLNTNAVSTLTGDVTGSAPVAGSLATTIAAGVVTGSKIASATITGSNLATNIAISTTGNIATTSSGTLATAASLTTPIIKNSSTVVIQTNGSTTAGTFDASQNLVVVGNVTAANITATNATDITLLRKEIAIAKATNFLKLTSHATNTGFTVGASHQGFVTTSTAKVSGGATGSVLANGATGAYLIDLGPTFGTVGFAPGGTVFTTDDSTFIVNAGTNAGSGTLSTAAMSDVTTWTARTSNFSTTAITGLMFGGGNWVAVGTSKIRYQTNPTSAWSTPSVVPTGSFRDCAYGGGWYVTIDSATNKIAATQTPSGTWTLYTISAMTGTCNSITYDGTRFLVGGTGVATQQIFTAPDPSSTWTTALNADQTGSGATLGVESITYDSANALWGAWLTSQTTGAGNIVLLSTDRSTWTKYNYTIYDATAVKQTYQVSYVGAPYNAYIANFGGVLYRSVSY